MMRKSQNKNMDNRQTDGASTGLAVSGRSMPLSARLWEDTFGWTSEFDRYFDNLRRNMESLVFPSMAGWGLTRAVSDENAAILAARSDLVDAGKEYVLTAEVPGFSRDQINLEVTPKGIEVRAEKQEEKTEGEESKGFLARERAYQSIGRAFEFPEAVVPDKVTAELKDGVLIVHVPKANPVEDKKTKVQIQ